MTAGPVPGVVRTWDDEEGWGVVDAAETPGGCWAHFSAVLVPGLHTLRPGQAVLLEHEPGPQDGFDFRATAVWPRGQEPHRTPPGGPSAAYRSRLTLSFDQPGAGTEPDLPPDDAGTG